MCRSSNWHTGNKPHRCEALLTLHAIADEACAGLGVALDHSGVEGCVYRARGRESPARTGSLARIDTRFLRVLPKVRTPPTGRPAFSRYACVQGPGVNVRWHKIPARHRGRDLRSEYANLLLLLLPLQVRASDFQPVEGSVQRLTKDPYGFFEFAPAEGLDLDLLDRVLLAARQEAGSVDVVMLPESAVEERDLDDLEAILDAHGVIMLQAGVREPTGESGAFPSNWLHIGVTRHSRKAGRGAARGASRGSTFARTSTTAGPWMKPRLSSTTSGVLFTPTFAGGRQSPYPARRSSSSNSPTSCWPPRVRGLRAARRSSQSSFGRSPTSILVGLLDGPQLTSRWSARYASVLADDPGSAVLTLTSFGMVQRSRPQGRDASRVIALWKDPTRGVREIPLDAGAQGVLLTVCMDRAHQVQRRSSLAGATAPPATTSRSTKSRPPPPARARTPSPSTTLGRARAGIRRAYDSHSLAEGVSEAAAYAPDRIDVLLAEARAGAAWRAGWGFRSRPHD